MNIEITGCIMCPFKRNTGYNMYCFLNPKIKTESTKYTLVFNEEIPSCCPIPKEGITIKPKQ